MLIQEITNEELDILPELDGIPSPYFNMPSGKEHYRLLRYVSSYYPLIFDIGTYQGYSALALSFGSDKVVSYDVEDHRTLYDHDIHFKIGNVLNDRELLKADLIVLDTFHDGRFEKKLTDYLDSNDYKGVLIADDIHFNQAMKDWWESIDREKYDITHIGHHSGTGVIYYK